MADPSAIPVARIGLRAYDVTLGFRNLDERSANLARFSRTHLTGMAALLAGTIKGRDVIGNAQALKDIAADVLKISPWAFDGVVAVLEELDLIKNVQRKAGEVVSFQEKVPILHDDTHERLGTHWRDSRPSELEQQFVTAIDVLAQSPLPIEELRSEIGADQRSNLLIREVGDKAELVRVYRLGDGSEIAASPLYAFEQPNSLIPLFESHSSEEVRDAFGRVRSQPGLPVLLDGTDPVVEKMIRLGLVPAPTVVGADKRKRAFVVVPYGLDPVYLTSKKQVLERAVALIASIRCGEVSGGFTPIRFPDSLLAALEDPDRGYMLRPHSSTERQYAPLIRLGVIEPMPVGNLKAARLVNTPDNIDAVRLARILLRRQGEALPERGNEADAANLLFTEGDYLAPIETIASARRTAPSLSQSEILTLWADIAWMGSK